ncbi:TadE/TadG family type IV pilus assembly protein [Arthrobacter sp. MDT2-16]
MLLKTSQRGAVAVEFALVVPLLILLLLGIIEVSRAFNAQATLASAARESVRVVAIGKNDSDAVNIAISAAEFLTPDLDASNIAVSRSPVGASNTCPSGSTATVTITYTMSTLTGIAAPYSVKGKGVMLCGG